MKIGILGAADIAKRRFLPAMKKCNNVELVMIAVSNENRLEAGAELVKEYGGEVVVGYEEAINNPNVDAVYIPLPPSLHYEWAKKALIAGKHVFVEKPSTVRLEDTLDLVNIAREKNLAIIENYGFVRHPQMKLIKETIANGTIGNIRNIRTAFGFPMRPVNDIRHKKILGGGSLLDAGGYTIKTGYEFLGNSAEIITASLSYLDEFDVDMYGTLTMENADRQTLQASFGMDNFYRCELEIWGQKGMIRAPRFYTAPDGFKPQIIVTLKDEEIILEADSSDQFLLQLEYFIECINNETTKRNAYEELISQIKQIECAFNMAR